VYYLALPLPATVSPCPWLGINKPGLLAFYDKDHGLRDGSETENWARGILRQYGLNDVTKHILLITMPRVLGYVFNPVSFYFCLDDHRQPRAVLCEVHNTFGEQHSYLCASADRGVIGHDEWLEAEKLFHVSPFLPRVGHYKFRFAFSSDNLGIWIDYYNAEENKQLVTSLTGKLTPLNASSLRSAFWSHPLVTIKTILLIHWQAVRLVAKGIRYVPKPTQLPEKLSSTRNLTKM
jgi:uncharacterized protein